MSARFTSVAMPLWAPLLALGYGGPPTAPDDAPIATEIADGIWVIEHPEAFYGEPNGNTTVVIGTRGVLVVDTGWPSAASADIALIRQWTELPVRWVVTTHWHSDHNLGNPMYRDTFPGMDLVMQAETKKQMDVMFPNYANMLLSRQRRAVATGMLGGQPMTPEVRTIVETRLGVMERLLAGYRYEPASVVFDDELRLDLGDREVRVMHPGRGNTAGDAVVYLPAEQILVTGDLVVHPLPYPYDGYPSEWAETLDALARMEVATIVPGHGPVLHETAYLRLVRDLFRSAVQQMNARMGAVGPALSRSLDELGPGVDLSSFRVRFAGDDPELLEAFDQVAAQVIRLVHQEAALR